MKRTLISAAVGAVLAASTVYALADIARPKVSPTTEQGKVVLHTGLTVTPDAQGYEARLQISEETLRRLRQATANTSTSESMTQSLTHSSTQTIMAGLFMFLAVSFAGVWLARSSQRRSQKVIVAVILGFAVLGAATVIVRANAGPPGYYRWKNVAENLTKGQPTQGGLDIEIVPGDDEMKLLLPLRDAKKPGEE
jgi:hypothetical protein